MEKGIVADRTQAMMQLIEEGTQTISACASHYEAAVIGSGPSGALAARQLALRGVSVVLIDRNSFPRTKVCGCCLSVRALQALETAGLRDLPEKLGGVRLRQLLVGSHSPTLRVPLTDSISLSREVFDTALAAHAIAAGAQFLPSCVAHVGRTTEGDVELQLEQNGERRVITASVLLVADGLGGTSLQHQERFAPHIQPGSRVGTGAVSQQAPPFYTSGTIFMAYGAGGYCGLVRLEDMRTDVAAAFDPSYLKECGSAAAAVSRILAECGWPVPSDVDTMEWKGTVPLTRKRPHVAGHRIFVIGDSASYVEPFTGEGIAWALASAQAVIPFAVQAARVWDDSLIWRWEHTYRRTIVRRQTPTKLVAQLLRNPGAATLASDVLSKVPVLMPAVVHQVSGPLPKEELEWLR